jgi:exodeoxyribonuclease-3
MKIATFNVNSLRAHVQNFLDWLNTAEPDVVLVQEVKATDDQFPHILFDSLGYNIKTFGQKSWNGVAVFSKYSIEEVVRGLPTYPSDENARMIECLIDGRIRLINCYMPNGDTVDSPKFQYKLEWMKKFTDYIANYYNDEIPTIIAGDYNVAIEDRDIWSPRAYDGVAISAPAARAIMNEWLQSGWQDAWRTLYPNDIGYTWIGYRGDSLAKGNGLRLDYFLLNAAAKPLLKDCIIDMSPRRAPSPSDHAPLILEIKD